MKLMKHIYQVGGIGRSHFFDASVYLIEAPESLYLIDCGTPEGIVRILDNIRSLGFDPADIRAVFGTHGHYDHVGAASYLKEHYGCRLYLHAEDRKRVEEGDDVSTTVSPLYGRHFPPCGVDRLLADGEAFDFGDDIRMEVLHTPGHTPGSVCFALEVDGFSFLVAGDTLYGGFSALTGSDETRWSESLEKLAARHFDGFSFGHMGPNVQCDADTRLAELRRQFAVYYNPWFKPLKDCFLY